MPCSFHVFSTQLSLRWYSKIKYACCQPIFGRVYDCKYSLILLSFNNWIILNFLYDVKDEAECEHMNINILSVNVTNIYFIILKLNYGTIDTDDTPFHGYYIIMFSLSRYTLQEDFNIDVQVISYGEIVCKGTNFSQ